MCPYSLSDGAPGPWVSASAQLEGLLFFSRSQHSDPALLRAQGLQVGRQIHQVSELRDRDGVWGRQGVQTRKPLRQQLSWKDVGPGKPDFPSRLSF